MVVYYIKKEGESLADYRYPIKEGDICMLYDGEVIKTVYIDSELEPNSIWRDFKFIDTKSLKSYQFPTSNSILCAPVGDKHAIGDTGLLTQLIKECKGEWLLDFLNETSAVLSGFVDFWDLGILSRFVGDNNLDVTYENKETLIELLENPEINEGVDEYDDEEGLDDEELLSKRYDVKWFCLSALACLEGQIDKRSYQILYDTLKGDSRSDIASRFHLTQERIRQIVVKTTKQVKELLIEQRNSINETKIENANLNAQLKLLKEEIENLKALLPTETILLLGNDNEELNEELVSLLETSLAAIKFPVRATNILTFMGIKKFGDIPQIESSMQVLNAKNSGRKTVHDVTQMLEDFYLNFGMSYTEIVTILKYKDWHAAKRKWIREGYYTENIKKIENNNEEKESLGNASTETSSNSTPIKGEERIGCAVKLLSSQQVGKIVNIRVNKKGKKLLIVRTDEGKIKAIEDVPFLYEILKKEVHSREKIKIRYKEETEGFRQEEATVLLTEDIIEAARTPNGGFTKSQLAAIGIGWPPPENWVKEKVGTLITPSQLADFNRIEYVAQSLDASYTMPEGKTYKDVAFNSDERRKMEATLQAMTHFYTPATPYDIARTISRSAWGEEVIRESTVDSILKRLPEVEYIKWGKYILKSRNK